MCTVLLFHRLFEESPLLLASNRDENLDRPALSPSWREDFSIPIFAPKDLEKGGTWLGLNEVGVLTAITNRFALDMALSEKKSRGMIPLLGLEYETAQESVAGLKKNIAPDDYPPFHLLIADKSHAFILWSDGSELHEETLLPGAHVITERSFQAQKSDREILLQDYCASHLQGKTPSDEGLADLLGSHSEEGFEGVCVHVPEVNYGTRSSSIIRLGQDGRWADYLFADEAPCRTAHRSLASHLKER